MFVHHVSQSVMSQMQGRNFKWVEERRREEKNGKVKMRGEEKRRTEKTTLYSQTPTSFHFHSLGGLGVIIVNHLITETKVHPRFGPDEKSAAALHRHPAVNRSKPMLSDDPMLHGFDTVAHKGAWALER